MQVISDSEARILASCTKFKTLRKHALSYCGNTDKFPKGPHAGLVQYLKGRIIAVSERENIRPVGMKEFDQVKRKLEQLASDGYLLSDNRIESHITALGDEDQFHSQLQSPRRIKRIGIPTRDRTRLLGRTLKSLIPAFSFDESFIVSVVDDSRDHAVSAGNRKLIATLTGQHDVNIYYTDRRLRTEFATILSRRGNVPCSVSRFALVGTENCNTTIGACRNTLLLDSIGTLCIQSDDDIIGDVVGPPEHESELCFTSDPSEFMSWYFRNPQECLGAVSFACQNVLNVHGDILGRSVVNCVAEVLQDKKPFAFDKITSAHLDNLALYGAKVAASLVGTFGASGTRNHWSRLFSGGDSFERLTRSELDYKENLNTDQVLRTTVRRCISDSAFCMAGQIGLDHRTFLPPFMPVGRGEDGVFGSILKVCFQDYFTGYLPYAVSHSPPEGSEVQRQQGAITYPAFCANDFLKCIIVSYQNSLMYVAESEAALHKLGSHLKDLSELSPMKFRHYLHDVSSNVVCGEISRAERLLQERRGRPSFWAADLSSYIRSAEKSLTRRDFIAPADLRGTAVERTLLLQEMIGKFANVVIYWPEIVRTSKALGEEGIRPTRSVTKPAPSVSAVE